VPKITIYVNLDEYEKLERMARARGTTVTGLVKQLVLNYDVEAEEMERLRGELESCFSRLRQLQERAQLVTQKQPQKKEKVEKKLEEWLKPERFFRA